VSHHLNNTTKSDKAVKLTGTVHKVQKLVRLKRGKKRTV